MEIKIKKSKPEKLIENLDYYLENGFMVLTERFLKRRGFCCTNGCRHCPYEDQPETNYSK
jgi:hypothetical protein